jgi:hypothetical protein
MFVMLNKGQSLFEPFRNQEGSLPILAPWSPVVRDRTAVGHFSFNSFIKPRSGHRFSSPLMGQSCFSCAEALLVSHSSLRSTANAPIWRLLLFHSAPNVSPQAKNPPAPPTARPEQRCQQWLRYGPDDREFETRLVAKYPPTEWVPEFLALG